VDPQVGGGRACDVCELVDGDASVKADTRYCPLCKAWMCNRCRGDLTRRAKAAGKRAGRGVMEALRGKGAEQ